MNGLIRYTIEPCRNVPATRGQTITTWLVAGIVAFAAAGCSKGPEQVPVFPVKGQLTAKGKPADGALVIFHPAGEGPAKDLRPVGHVAADGSFDLTTYSKNDGAPAGDYKVTVVWLKKIAKGKSGEPENGPSLVPEPYTKPGSTTLAAKIVDNGPNQLATFELSGNPAPISTASRPTLLEE